MVRLAVCVVLALGACGPHRPEQLRIQLESDRLPADGFSSSNVTVRTASGKTVPAILSIVEGHRIIRVEDGRLRTTINPGRAVIEARYRRDRPGRAALTTEPSVTDRAGDGTPDFLRLDDLAERKAFTDSFASIAEAQYSRTSAEVTDCSALIRYAYRESLRRHSGKYSYPLTPLGSRLFRVSPGPFREADMNNEAFAEFADAETLRRWNTHFISREIGRAQRADLLFYRQPDQRSPAHAMIFLGDAIVYHTGPIGRDKGEVRRPGVEELQRHPEPRWRPLLGNSNFLGVYRWNILRQD